MSSEAKKPKCPIQNLKSTVWFTVKNSIYMKNVQLTRLAPFNFGVVLYSIASPLSVYNNGCQILGLPYA